MKGSRNLSVRVWNNSAMSNGGGNDGQNLVIEVLLHEYDALRDEVLSRTSARFQLLGYLSIAASLLGVSNVSKNWIWVYLVVITLVTLIVLWLYFGWAIRRCAVRLREIEIEVNGTLGQEVILITDGPSNRV